MKPGKNRPCPCGSGKKFKLCCMTEEEKHIDKSKNYINADLFSYADISVDSNESLTEIDDLDQSDGFESVDSDSVVDRWWKHFMPHYKKRNTGEMLSRINSFIDEHPDKVKDLGLEEECIYELGEYLARKDKKDQFIELLYKIEKDAPEAFEEIAGYAGVHIINSLIASNNIDKIDQYLAYVIEEPVKHIDELMKLIDILAVVGLEDKLFDLASQTANSIRKSDEMMWPYSVANKLAELYYSPYLNGSPISDAEVEELAEKINVLYEATDDCIELETIQKNINHAANYNMPIESIINKKMLCGVTSEVLFWRFIGFLKNEKGFPCCTAFYFSEKILEYMISCSEESKKKDIFTAKLLEKYIIQHFRQFFSVDGLSALSLLQAVIYMGEFISANEAKPLIDLSKLIKICLKLELKLNESLESTDVGPDLLKEFPEYIPAGNVT